tara:strand:- start:205 stop:456 length:252 start_codon:yes stop_codon:yes gene_type:complete
MDLFESQFGCLVFLVEIIAEILPPLSENNAPQTWNEAWTGFDPRKEPLDVEIFKECQEDGVVIRLLRYQIKYSLQQRVVVFQL